MAINEHLEQIKTAVYGEDVRDAIHDAIQQCYDDEVTNIEGTVTDYIESHPEMIDNISGAPTVVSTVASMTDTSKPYLYAGTESGYTAGHWYYHDGTEWVDGGQYGTDGGVNTNARNILRYILQKVAYTEQGMQTYVDALYQALAQPGGGGSEVTTYMIMNALTHVTNSNDATGADEGDSYTATLTADTDYAIDTVTVTMGGVDITSTVYSNGEINIASVTGDVIITAVASIPPEPFYYGKVNFETSPITGSYITDTGAIETATSDSGYYEDYIDVRGLSSFLIHYTGYSGNINFRVSIYDSTQTFTRQLHPQSSAYYTVNLVNGESYIRLGWYSSSVPTYYIESTTPETAIWEIGDIDGSTGEDITGTNRLRTKGYIPASDTIVINDFSWYTGRGYFFRCYDSSYGFIGTLIGSGNAYYGGDKTLTLPTGTAYVRILIQAQVNQTYSAGFTSGTHPYAIDGTSYQPTEE